MYSSKACHLSTTPFCYTRVSGASQKGTSRLKNTASKLTYPRELLQFSCCKCWLGLDQTAIHTVIIALLYLCVHIYI